MWYRVRRGPQAALSPLAFIVRLRGVVRRPPSVTMNRHRRSIGHGASYVCCRDRKDAERGRSAPSTSTSQCMSGLRRSRVNAATATLTYDYMRSGLPCSMLQRCVFGRTDEATDGIVLNALLHARPGLIQRSMAQTGTERTMMSIRCRAWSEFSIVGLPRSSTSDHAGSPLPSPSSSSSCHNGFSKNGLRVSHP